MQIHDALTNSAQWLLSHREANSGWGEMDGRPPSALNTAEVLLALMAVDSAAGDQAIQEAAAFLARCQNSADPKHGDHGAWPRRDSSTQPKERGADMVRTSFALQALIRVGRGIDDAPVKRGLDWVSRQQCEDGGWPFPSENASELMPTCFALLALLAARRAGDDRRDSAIEKGLEHLVTYAKPDGHVGEDDRLAGPHTIHTLLVLQAAREQDVGSGYGKIEKRALDWLLRNPDRAKRLVEDSISYAAPDGTSQHFEYLHMTDAQLTQVLSAAEESRHRRSALATEALNSIKDKMQDDGGFLGYRTFSWSTAKVVVGLRAAQREYSSLPERKSELPGRKDLMTLLIVVALVLTMAILSVTGDFGWAQVFTMLALLLGALLVGGMIDQTAFKALVGRMIDKLPSGSTSEEPKGS